MADGVERLTEVKRKNDYIWIGSEHVCDRV